MLVNFLESQLFGIILGGAITIVGTIVGSWCQARNFRRSEELKQKRDVFHRFVGNRHNFAGKTQTPEEPYTSLMWLQINEVYGSQYGGWHLLRGGVGTGKKHAFLS